MPTRVALITPPLDSSGGIGRLMTYVVTSMSADDIVIRVLDPRGHSKRPILSVFALIRAWIELLLMALSGRVDIAHINVSSHGSSIRKPVMLWTCRLFRIPTILHLHASEYPEFFTPLPHIAKRFLRHTFSSADVVLVLGFAWRDYVCAELQVPAQKVRVLLNAAPGPMSREPLQPRGLHPLRILFLGRLGARKGVPDLLRALADPRFRGESWTVTLAGDGDVESYRTEADGLGIADRVTFSGWVDAGETRQMLIDSHLLVLPSHAEGLPMSLIEAFAHSVPVVTTPVGSIPDIVESYVNGLLVEPGNSAQLANAILTLMRDEPLRLKLAENARRTWEERLDIASYSRDLSRYWHLLSMRVGLHSQDQSTDTR